MNTWRPEADEPPTSRPGFSRRTVLTGAAAGLAAVAIGSQPAQAAPVYTPIPKLPGEVSRTDTRTTRLGKKPFETIDVVWGTDTARLYVPWATPPKARAKGGVVWFYHSNGSTHTALDGAYNYGAMMAVDQGAVCICPLFGGPSTWTTQAALTHQVNWSKYVSGVFTVGVAFARANSGGAALMTYAYATNLVPALKGIYLANGTYDMEELYSRDPGRIGPPYGDDPALIAATNPARLPQASWTGKRFKAVVSLVDPVVPPTRHGLAMADLARPVATDVRVQQHDQGHVVPSWTQQDMISTFASWL
ncbi:hypothetical protein [Modestobacter versicolor]|uniref:Acyl-CoA:diacylglycerol acyltransferase n=1 Tax=Modestobacter versicolor TaxID=429133 RepID=A0A323VFR1_9ACTN|nr:hypothetical protein [Modestobacter versicolor]MBB3676980.1 hypothetical protein [Modestobacter versicolor]PZA22893.1 hypothetical protein DMO24_02845 [Modestobacter versicolor]